MTKKERSMLFDALESLHEDPCAWEDAMVNLYALAGVKYNDIRKIKGNPVSLSEIMTGKKDTCGI